MPSVIPPTPGRDDAFFWDGVADDQLVIRACASCGTVAHPPVPMCGSCHGLEWKPIQASGEGVVLGAIISRHPTEPDGPGRIVVLVELPEGARIVSNLTNATIEQASSGAAVEFFFDEIDGVRLPLCRLVQGAGEGEV